MEEENDREAGSISAPTHRIGLRLIELARSLLGCQRISISVRDPETGVMHALAVSGFTPAEERRWWAEQRAAEEQGLRLEDTPEQELAQSLLAGESVSIDLRDPRYRDAPNPYGIQTMLIAPMVIGETLYGVISLDYAGEAHEFTTEELKLASAVSKLAALVIERDRMLREQAAAEARTLALTQANERMNEFLGIAAHELRTPITVIKANLQLLLRRAAVASSQTQQSARGTLDERLARHGDALLVRTERSLARLTRLVDDLLDVSRMRTGRLEMQIEPINLAEVARDAAEEQRMAAPERTIALEEPEDAPLLALADPARVDQVVTNYVTNALKYSSATSAVHVRVWREGANGFVSVSDGGVGISEKELSHVWELFHRIPGIEVVSGSGIGLGLGLHLCKTIIERQGGEVGVTSQVGVGSTFWFSLPLLLN
jgi:signal transduction histidine kinase